MRTTELMRVDREFKEFCKKKWKNGVQATRDIKRMLTAFPDRSG